MAYRNLLDIITDAGEASDLISCVDVGDATSYPGTGQGVFDLSGNGNNFNRGASVGAESTDPTFAGTAGALDINTRFTNDGNDFCRSAVGNTPYLSFHKDNAVFTLLFGVKVIAGSSNYLLGNFAGSAASSSGFFVSVSSTNNLHIEVRNAGTIVCSADLAVPGSGDRYAVVAVSLDEAGGASASLLFANGASATFNGAYSSPSSGNPSGNTEIMSRGQGSALSPSGMEFFFAAIWTRALSLAGLSAIYNEAGLRLDLVAELGAALDGEGVLSAALTAGAATLAATLTGEGTLAGVLDVGPAPSVADDPIHAIATHPVASPDEPTLPETEDLLRLNDSAVIDLVYLLEARPFAPAGTSLPA